MNDYEINLRLAEIAGVDPLAMCDKIDDGKRPAGYGTRWSPLTDWSQLGPLMEARWPTVAHEPGDGGYSVSFNGGSTWRFYETDDPKRAICLAIIAAHEGETNA